MIAVDGYSAEWGYDLKMFKGLKRDYRRVKRHREAQIGIGLALVFLMLVAIIFTAFNPFVIEIGDKLVVTSPKKQQQLNMMGMNTSSSKPFGMALGDTLMGQSQADLNSEMTALSSFGVSWIRIDVAWADLQPNSASQALQWSKIDPIVSAAKAHHLHILATLAYTPSWAAVAGCDDSSQKCTPASDAQFANYATSVAKRYNSTICAFEIWNEENNQGFWTPAPNAVTYTNLLKATYPALKKVDPSAPVLLGSFGPLDDLSGSQQPVTFLSDLYAAGARGYFDVVGFHPYSYPALPDTVASWSGWSMMNDLPTSIRSVMTANGDSNKQVWITEYGAPTNGPGPTETDQNYGTVSGDDHLDEQLQAETVTQSTQQYMQYSWLGNYFWYSFKDLGSSTADTGNFFGLIKFDGTHKAAYDAFAAAIQAADKSTK